MSEFDWVVVGILFGGGLIFLWAGYWLGKTYGYDRGYDDALAKADQIVRARATAPSPLTAPQAALLKAIIDQEIEARENGGESWTSSTSRD